MASYTLTGTDFFLGKADGSSVGGVDVFITENVLLDGSTWVGPTQGVSINYESSVAEIMSDQTGTSPFALVVTGQKMTVTANVIGATEESLSRIFPNIYQQSTSGVVFTNRLYDSSDTISTALTLQLVNNAGLSANKDKLVIPKAFPKVNATWSFDASAPRQYTIEWTCLPSTTTLVSGEAVIAYTPGIQFSA